MNVKHTIAASLAAILLIQSAATGQAAPDQEIRTIPRQRAVQVLLANLTVGADVRIDLGGGERVEGRLVDKSDQELVVLHDRQRLIVSTADVVGVRAAMPKGMTGGKAFGIGAGIGFGAIFGWFLMLAAGSR